MQGYLKYHVGPLRAEEYQAVYLNPALVGRASWGYPTWSQLLTFKYTVSWIKDRCWDFNHSFKHLKAVQKVWVCFYFLFGGGSNDNIWIKCVLKLVLHKLIYYTAQCFSFSNWKGGMFKMYVYNFLYIDDFRRRKRGQIFLTFQVEY